MTVREFINKLMDLDLDKPIYLTEFCEGRDDDCVGYIGSKRIKLTKHEIIDVDIHGVYGTYFNCVTIK